MVCLVLDVEERKTKIGIAFISGTKGNMERENVGLTPGQLISARVTPETWNLCPEKTEGDPLENIEPTDCAPQAVALAEPEHEL